MPETAHLVANGNLKNQTFLIDRVKMMTSRKKCEIEVPRN